MPLQKSFSEQNGSLKTRQRWHKSKSHPTVSQPFTATDPRPRPLEPIAEATKNKLNAFNFCPLIQKHEANEPVKCPSHDENDVSTKDDAVSPQETGLPALPPAPSKSITTPVSRLAWQDLIGGSDINGEDDDTSPHEKVEWDTKQQPMYGISPMPRKRGTKRARSSSPTSSPAVRSKPITPTVNVKKLSAALKSPHADPAMELWDRFSLSGSAAATPLGTNNPALAQIMVSSSPRPSKSTGAGHSDGGLRRAISCGANWPKRRRVERVEVMPPADVTAEESPSCNSKSSMVNALLKTVTGEINRSKAAQTQLDGLKSPSPRKRRHNPSNHLSDSPKQRAPPSRPSPPLFPGRIRPPNDTSSATEMDNSSDYGDDDFDDDTLLVLGAGISPAQESESQVVQPQALDTGQTMIAAPTAKDICAVEDDFGDLDDDIFAAAEGLISQIDSTRHVGQHKNVSQGPTTMNLPLQDPVIDGLAEDIYGDDFGGDFDFDAAEIAATQSAKQPIVSAPPVRRS
ncbi:hypothetical protein F5Y19DRAFT_139946 [Xylariaceae sp. FL1651]|nr:hypothetical protein F5Y19DRAFT_139946 [Xylariaceae sp. FL1651]